MSESDSPIIADLKWRLDLGTHLIRMLEQSDLSSAEIQSGVAELQAQQRKVNEKLVAAIAARREAMGIPEPEPVVVSLKPMQMKAKVNRPTEEVSHGRR